MIDKKLEFVKNFYSIHLSNITEVITNMLVAYAGAPMGEELSWLIRIVGWFVAGPSSFCAMYKVLYNLLYGMEQTAFALL